MDAWMAILTGGFVGFLLGWYIERIIRALQRITAFAMRSI